MRARPPFSKIFTRARVRCVAADVVEAGLLWRPSAIKFYGSAHFPNQVFYFRPWLYHFEKVHSFSGSSSYPGSTTGRLKEGFSKKFWTQLWKFSKFQWFFKVLQRWKISNFGLIGSRTGRLKEGFSKKFWTQLWKFSKFQWFFKVLQRWKISNFGLIGSRSGSRIRKRTDAHFSCVLLTGNKSRKSEVGVLQVKRPKITKIQVRNRIDRYDFMKISSKIKRRSASIHKVRYLKIF